MSALGHKRTFAVQYLMSALHLKADMCSATRDVRFVPIADIWTIPLQKERSPHGGLSKARRLFLIGQRHAWF